MSVPEANITPAVFVSFLGPESNEMEKALKQFTVDSAIQSTRVRGIAIKVSTESTRILLSKDNATKIEQAALETFVKSALGQLDVANGATVVVEHLPLDLRRWTGLLMQPWPESAWCLHEGAKGAWPDILGGDDLATICRSIGLPKTMRPTPWQEDQEWPNAVQWLTGRIQAMRLVYARQIQTLPLLEQRVAQATWRLRRWNIRIDADKFSKLEPALISAMSNCADALRVILKTAGVTYAPGDITSFLKMNDAKEITQIDDKALEHFLVKHLQARLTTTNHKLLTANESVSNPIATRVLQVVGEIRKSLSLINSTKKLKGKVSVPVELVYAAAITFRFSSKNVGVGINLHGIPKHLVAVAKPLRKSYKAPAGFCFVRGDLANVEYRICGKLTGCRTVINMFDPSIGGSIGADPYSLSWASMTGNTVTKKDPERQVAKTAVLGLSFLMGVPGYVNSLLLAIADKDAKIKEADLEQTVAKLHWEIRPHDLAYVVGKTGCSPTIATAAHNIHRLFNKAHQDFGITADWLVSLVDRISACDQSPAAASVIIEEYMRSPRAPQSGLITVSVDNSMGDMAVRVGCGHWPTTLSWRSPKYRIVPEGKTQKPQLTILKADGAPRAFTRQLAIENITQAAARNALCEGILRLGDEHGLRDVIHVHDEALILVPKTRNNILHARAALLSVFGATSGHSMSWAAYMKPEEISVTESFWEEESDIDPKKGNRWARIEADAPGCLNDLP